MYRRYLLSAKYGYLTPATHGIYMAHSKKSHLINCSFGSSLSYLHNFLFYQTMNSGNSARWTAVRNHLPNMSFGAVQAKKSQ